MGCRTIRWRRVLLLMAVTLMFLYGIFSFVKMTFFHFSNEVSAFYVEEEKVPTTTIILDAGHGGYDSGSLSIDNIAEKDITLNLTLLIGERLEEAGYKVVYTRTSDDVDWESDNVADLQARVEKGIEADADYFISIHTNSNDFGEASGFETYLDLQDTKMIEMAYAIHEQLSLLEYSQDRGLKDALENQLYVVSCNPVPALLIEIGFITDEQDVNAMINEDQQLADAVAQGIIQTLEEENT